MRGRMRLLCSCRWGQGRFEKTDVFGSLSLSPESFLRSRLLHSLLSNSLPTPFITHLARALAPVAHWGSERSCWCVRVVGEGEERGSGQGGEKGKKNHFGEKSTTLCRRRHRHTFISSGGKLAFRGRRANTLILGHPSEHARSSKVPHGPKEREKKLRKQELEGGRRGRLQTSFFHRWTPSKLGVEEERRFFSSPTDSASDIHRPAPPLVSLECIETSASGLKERTMSEKGENERA